MQYFVIFICAVLILLAVFIFIRTLIRSFKGRCCENCKGCAVKDKCTLDKKQDELK